ncbi:hypothetical protein BACINT_03811 [Bacteroides intestinalis DSM 17393]|uniref:Uncharacterized protein n=1 Tax=Bacteroides intestinalis DSM 17393 TaxID=471870 RepID=B3CCG3_9BACE|nr:hypothetical protein BACINT_03811 [Bacteroides intestinalis DSM 17393]
METLNKNGVSITQTLGEEKYVKYYIVQSEVNSLSNMIPTI